MRTRTKVRAPSVRHQEIPTPTTPTHIEMYMQMEAAYDEASKIIGLSDDHILALLDRRDQYRRLIDEWKSAPASRVLLSPFA